MPLSTRTFSKRQFYHWNLTVLAGINGIWTHLFFPKISLPLRLGETFRETAVHLSDPLPDPELVHSQNLILKLHGDLSQTRADDSLDLPPSLEDKRRFFIMSADDTRNLK